MKSWNVFFFCLFFYRRIVLYLFSSANHSHRSQTDLRLQGEKVTDLGIKGAFQGHGAPPFLNI